MTYPKNQILAIQSLPENLAARVWQELIRATKDRHHGWKTPALATIGIGGNPQVRTIVLRHANSTLWTLDAYTDLRSSKCHELMKHPHAQLVFWSAKLNWQLRVSIVASVYSKGDLVDQAWARMRQSKSAKDYLSEQAPGQVLVDMNQHTLCLPEIPAIHHLAVLRFEVISMDWLELGRETHYRAHIDPAGQVTPLSP